MSERSRYGKVSQRAAGAGNAACRNMLNGLTRALRNLRGVDGDGNPARYPWGAHNSAYFERVSFTNWGGTAEA
jgi:hypothetical protein